jgi:hypothetical protein
LTDDEMTFKPKALGTHDSIKGFRVVAPDGGAGRVSWASYKPGESYVVLTTGLLRRKHRVLPAGAVASADDGAIHVSLSRDAIKHLPLLPHPEAPVAGSQDFEQMLNPFERAYTVSGFPRN